jgi:aminopeptidase N
MLLCNKISHSALYPANYINFTILTQSAPNFAAQNLYMKQFLSLAMAIAFPFILLAQPGMEPKDTSWKKMYRASGTRINNLIHTKLDVKPDFSKSYLYGKAWITATPHFYPTDSLTLDAKYFIFNTVALVKGGKMIPLQYEKDDFTIRIKLDRTYKANERYTVYIDYTARPDEFEEKYDKGAQLGIKGLFFIDPKDEDPTKPTQIWTQGESESSSGWFPTIDKTNQKTTQELTVTVDNKYVTLSNGKLMSQKKNADGTRSDYWKMDLPHAPYLFFLGVGEYAIIKDSYKGKEVNYYVEKEYKDVAKRIFGLTPEMMAYFSKLTGVEYPWIKYSQITGRDYVAGAMENTTATIHQESAQQDARELVDGNNWETTVVHELFHQWFGDYVTTESWSNLTLNESFANYSETLWNEYKYGKDEGDAQNLSDMQGYLMSGSEKKDLVRFYYANEIDMFDAVSYNKGGRILHMLRNHIGDSAFFKSLNLYLTTNKFKSAEAHQLRMAFEEVTGRDLNWYFNQWYYGSGHPKLDIDYTYDDAAGVAKVIMKQTQRGDKVFRLPVAIDVYNGNAKKRYPMWMENKTDTFYIPYTKRPDLINVDGDKILLAEKKDNKTLQNFIHQYKFAGNYVDRREALEYCSRKQEEPAAMEIVKLGLKDRSPRLRNFTLTRLDLKKDAIKQDLESAILGIAKTDKDPIVRGTAIRLLGNYLKAEYRPIFEKAINDSSYTVAGFALEALSKLDGPAAAVIAKKLVKEPNKGVLAEKIGAIIIANSNPDEAFDDVASKFDAMSMSQAKFQAAASFAEVLEKVNDVAKLRKGVDLLLAFRDGIPEAIRPQTNGPLNAMLTKIAKTQESNLKADNTAMKEVIDYIRQKAQ